MYQLLEDGKEILSAKHFDDLVLKVVEVYVKEQKTIPIEVARTYSELWKMKAEARQFKKLQESYAKAIEDLHKLMDQGKGKDL